MATIPSEDCKEKHNKILLFLSNNQVLVWDKETVMTLRKQHHIVGALVGSLPSKPRQNLIFSLPLILLPEEAKLLLDKNIAKMVESQETSPSQETVRKFQDEREANMQEQMERLQDLKQQKLADFADIIEEGREKGSRKRKRSSKDYGRKQRLVENEQKQSFESKITTNTVEQSETHTSDSIMQSLDTSGLLECTVDFLRQERSEEGSDGTNKANLQDSTLVCVDTKAKHIQTKDINWKFPETEIERIRYKVFSDLWEKGYFITNGNKFGGDYLVYPGDPLRFHSHFIVKVLPWGERFTGLDLICVGRLGSTVKKTSVLASVDESGNVIYTSIQWSGFL
ncbi:tRNA-splicing endonuclease subunit Sen34-like [Dendronephthya gigantea]|uniref:tRNA-splicing endonuclease subunit Sen34-like n=1 Tax=Dendronephthya gigantea TaxID=151771 RepID=UPI001068D711|nr:tRNA-splicing endonuclease subunit Sen34-like [Dendronephthya gigantea]